MKTEEIKALRMMAKYPTVTVPRDPEILKAAADFIEAALSEKQGPGFWLSAEYINDLVINSLKDLIRRAKWCSICDVDLRENGKNVRFEADWIKYMEWRDTHPDPSVNAQERKD